MSESGKVEVYSVPLPKVRVETLPLGWNIAMHRPPKVSFQTGNPELFGSSVGNGLKPPVLTLKITPPTVRVDSFYFAVSDFVKNGGANAKTAPGPDLTTLLAPDSEPGSAEDETDQLGDAYSLPEDVLEDGGDSFVPDGVSAEELDQLGEEDAEETAAEPAEDQTASSEDVPALAEVPKPEPEEDPTYTRLRPPQNLIKLEDRLHYLLQPPLEQLYSDHSLMFPFEPFHYQWEGVSFLYARDAAILADEMGLGKTMQAITTVRLLLRSGDIKRVLFVCPKPLVTNWKREFEIWAPEIPVLVIEGDPVRREWQWGLQDIPVKIANYELLHRDRDFYAPKKGVPKHFDLVVLDESQRIKNQRSATSMAVRSISRSRSWAMTGTPIENSSDDLVGIFEFLAPGFLRSDMKPGAMSRAIGDYVLRRTKDLVMKDMPPRLFRDAEMYLTPEQRQTYQMAESKGMLRLTEMGDAVTIQHVFELVLRLKQICNFDPATGDSPKLQRLEADLEEIAASGRKAIVFSQWTETIFRLKKALARFSPLEYHGKIPPRERDGILKKFREEPEHTVLLMSYGAGSVGLNLQFCNYVFLFDRWWNPAVEDQAINRAHRIGVNGAVTVTRFLMLGTIEEKIDRVLREKRDLFETIISGSAASEHKRKIGLTQDDVFGLFQLKSPKGKIKIP